MKNSDETDSNEEVLIMHILKNNHGKKVLVKDQADLPRVVEIFREKRPIYFQNVNEY